MLDDDKVGATKDIVFPELFNFNVFALIVFVLIVLPFTVKLPEITKYPTLSSVINEDPVPAVRVGEYINSRYCGLAPKLRNDQ